MRVEPRSAWKERRSPDSAGYITPDPEPENAAVWFFTRIGGISRPPYDSLNVSVKVGDEKAAVAENLTRIKHTMSGNQTAWVRQVAGDMVWQVTEGGLAGEGDALLTGEKDLSLAVAVADCVPVALVGPEAVGMVHSGWRGTLSGISGKTAAELGETSGVRAYIGPGIRGCCYEVSTELAESFRERFGEGVVSGRQLSLPAAIQQDLTDAGVAEIHDLGLCTGCRRDLFFSHRKEGPHTGRNLAAVARV